MSGSVMALYGLKKFSCNFCIFGGVLIVGENRGRYMDFPFLDILKKCVFSCRFFRKYLTVKYFFYIFV